ncbi:hypothetical protein Hanom_Chr17g01589121 [Helianthus anomalus]
MFDYCNYQIPLSKFLIDILMFHEVHLSQVNPFSLAKVCQFELSYRGLGSDPYLDDAGRIQKFPEQILLMGRISTIWSELEYYPTLHWGGEVMGLNDALRLKSFDSNELDIRATKTPKEDPSYLTIISENLYKIRDPIAAGDQGGSGSAPPKQAINVSLIRTVSVAASDKGKAVGSSAKPAGKVVVLDDEADRLTEFSAAGSLLENLSAYRHGGKTPRDRPFTLP